VAPPLEVVAEAGVASSADLGSRTAPAFALVGAIWSIADGVHLDAGARVALTEPEADLAALAGAVVRF
jgi:hypothetical protein